MAKDLQWKYQNNKIVGDGYIRAEITQDDCPAKDAEFYVATLPEGAIVLDMLAYVDGVELPTTADMGITVDIGMNDCQFCMANDLVIAAGKTVVCNESCKCTMADQDYLIRIKLKNDLLEGRIVLLVHIILTENVVCEADPIKLCYETTIVDPCTGGCECDTPSCGPVGLSTVVASNPAAAAAGDTVTGTVTITNTGTLAATDVSVDVDLPAGYKAGTESYATDKGVYNAATDKFTIPRLAVGETAVLTIKGQLEEEIVLTASRAEALDQENTAATSGDTLTDTTTKT